MRKLFLLLIGFIIPTSIFGDTLTGGTGATVPSIPGSDSNPANAVYLKRTEFLLMLPSYKNDNIKVKYPGSPTLNRSIKGINMPRALPGYVVKHSKKISWSLVALPPVPLNLPVSINELPLNILNSINFVNMEVDAKINGSARGLIAYKFSRNLALGLSADYLATDVTSVIKDFETNEDVASIKVNSVAANLRTGIRYRLSKSLILGASSRIYSYSKRKVETSVSVAGGSQPASIDQTTDPLKSVLLGLTYRTKRRSLFLDLAYDRADKTESFSLVDLARKERDSHDPLAVRLGGLLKMNPRFGLLFGGRYEPSGIGSGSPGANGKGGFSSMELLQLFAGSQELKPYWELGGGIETHFAKEKKFYSYTLRIGVTYSDASLGVDSNGELPGAYKQTKLQIPLSIKYRI